MTRSAIFIATILAAAAAHSAPLATEGFVTNKIAAAISQIPPPDYSTSNTELVETIEATAPAPGNYAAVSNRAMTALQSYTETDPTVPAWAKAETQPLPPNYSTISNKAMTALQSFTETDPTVSSWAKAETKPSYSWSEITSKPSFATVATSGSYNDLSNKPTIPTVPTNVSSFNNDAGYLTSYTETDPTISAWAKAASKPTYTADEVGAVSSNKIEEVRTDNAQTRQIVTTWENFLDGSNVVFSITNYLSGSYNLDAAKLRILELREGEYHEVYNSRDEILLHIENFTTNDFRVATNQLVGAVNEAIGGKADRDWGKYTSAGGEAPSNTVYMTAPNTVFAGGLEYERVAVGEETICVLTTRGAPVWTQGDEGTFKFQDDGGTNYFGFAKTDSYTIGANTDGRPLMVML